MFCQFNAKPSQKKMMLLNIPTGTAGVVVGPLGFEPRIARAPGVYPNPEPSANSQDTHLTINLTDDLSKLDDGPKQAKQVNIEDIKVHGFSLNLDKEGAFQDYNKKIENTLLKMLTDGLKKNTRRQTCNTLRRLNKLADLMNPESIKTEISKMQIKNSSKQPIRTAVYAKADKRKARKLEKDSEQSQTGSR